jgi:predicted nucleic acid-binding protein
VTRSAAGIPRVWILDATPVITLAKIGQLDLLTRMADELLLPSPVVREICRGPAADSARQAVESGWGVEVPVDYLWKAVRALGLLGRGEQSVLTLALKRPGALVILDDGQARKAARELGLLLAGTIGVIEAAKSRALIPAVVPLFHALRPAGSYVEESLLRQAAVRAGEGWL